MALSFRRDPEPQPVEALVFADGFIDFEALAQDMDSEFGVGQWELVSDEDTQTALESPDGAEFAILAVSEDDPAAIEEVAELIRRSREAGLLVLLVVGDISSRSIHRLLREGVSEFAPYPDTEGALPEAIGRMRLAKSGGHVTAFAPPTIARQGRVITIYGAAGGVGASTFAVNLAWETAMASRKKGFKVALMDFNFQFGAIATYLDVPRREAVYELVSEASNLDQTGLSQALSTYQDKLHVLTAPRDALPLDIVTPADISAIIKLAREAFDYVFIDMPQALMSWSEQVYIASDEFYALMEIDMRSAQNVFRFMRTLKAEDMALDRLKFVLNRAPGMTDLSGKARVRRVAESLGIKFANMLPDGGRQVMNACDQGVPLMEAARSNPLRKEIAKAAEALLAAETAQAQAGAAE